MNGAIPTQKKDLILMLLRTNAIIVRSTLYGEPTITRKPIPSTSSMDTSNPRITQHES